MKRIILIALFVKVTLFIVYILSKNNDYQESTSESEKDYDIDFESLTNNPINTMELENAKTHYPFAKWRLKATDHGMKQYTQENCEAIELILDELIADLKLLPTKALAEDKVILFKYAVLATNAMDCRIEGFIETGEREDLCELMDQITIAAGLEPTEFADGEGIASEWREW